MQASTAKYLTEKVLVEKWHEPSEGKRYIDDTTITWPVCWCGKMGCTLRNRTFTTMTDLIALFEVIHKDGKWNDFENYVQDRSPFSQGVFFNHIKEAIKIIWGKDTFSAWLFCLNAPDQIEARCEMVAEWHRGK